MTMIIKNQLFPQNLYLILKCEVILMCIEEDIRDIRKLVIIISEYLIMQQQPSKNEDEVHQMEELLRDIAYQSRRL